MACPFFEPRQKLETGPLTHVPRLPLGAAYSGVCRVTPGDARIPTDDHQREFCNHGYARGACEDFPAESPGDAIRFSTQSTADAKQTVLVYIVEKNHAPLTHEIVEFPAGCLRDELLFSQARAFVQSFRND